MDIGLGLAVFNFGLGILNSVGYNKSGNSIFAAMSFFTFMLSGICVAAAL